MNKTITITVEDAKRILSVTETIACASLEEIKALERLEAKVKEVER